MSADPELLRALPHSDVGEILARDAAVVLGRWSQRIRARFPETHRVHEAALRDHLPHILAALAEQLASTDADDAQHHRPALLHGATRWDEGWSISEVVYDYLLLRLVVLDHLAESLDRPLSMNEIMAVGLVLDEVIALSAAAYEASREAAIRGSEERRIRELTEHGRRKDEFLATLGHELRNPLAAMASALELASLVEPDDPVAGEARDILNRQVRQMTRLVDDLLDVSRIARGKLELRIERIELGALCRQVGSSLQPHFEAQQQSFDVHLPGDSLWIDADPARLQQALTNTLMNAAKFTPPGGAIALSLQAEAAQAVVRVRDNGHGIDSSLLPRIFELYTQADDSSGAGLGIGLALVRQLVELHGGSVAAHSDGPGCGAEFTIRLPLVEASTAHFPAPAAPAPSAVEKSAYRRALVVEDDADLAAMLAKLISQCGVDVRVATDGPSALQVAGEFLPDLVLLDIGLPETNGYDVAAQLRAMPSLASVVFVALTGYAQAEDRQRSQEAGFVSHLVKPVSFETLQRVLAAGETAAAQPAPAGN